MLDILENNKRYLNQNPKCEPQLGKRGLYRTMGGNVESKEAELAMLWVLNLSDGRHSLLDVAERSKLAFSSVSAAARALGRGRSSAGGRRTGGGKYVTTALSGVAVVTGASGGIGRATACALAAKGMSVCLTGRDVSRLQNAATAIRPRAPQVLVHPADLSTDEGIRSLVANVGADIRRIDVLVHAAGTMCLGNVESVGWDDLDEQYRMNLRAPFLLTKAFLPMLKETRGQVVFVNSTAGLAAGADNGLYAATKHALRSIAGSIRDHVNPYGIRVVSIFPGRTATTMQEAVHRFEGRRYEAAELVQANDIAELIVGALALPRTAEVTDIMVRPMKMPSPARLTK